MKEAIRALEEPSSSNRSLVRSPVQDQNNNAHDKFAKASAKLQIAERVLTAAAEVFVQAQIKSKLQNYIQLI